MSSQDDPSRVEGASEPVRLEMEGRTDRGKVRSGNEDCWGVDISRGLVVVADGVGGHSGGEVASELATRLLVENLSQPGEAGSEREAVLAAIAEAHREVWETARKLPHLSGMATTIVIGLFRGPRLHLAHVGDSRAYRLSGSRLERLTQDHSLVEEMVRLGMFASVEEALNGGIPPSMLTRGLGIDETPAADYLELAVETGDLFLFCTDGLTGMVDDQTIAQVLGDPDLGLSEKADRLVALALENGGLDNITLVLAQPVGPVAVVSGAS